MVIGQDKKLVPIDRKVICLDFVRAPDFGLCFDPCRIGLVRSAPFDSSELKIAKYIQSVTRARFEMKRAAGASTSYAVTADRLAIVTVWGDIGCAQNGAACTFESLKASLMAVRADSRAAAILIVVNSPGGEFEGVDEIVELIREIADEKPVYAHVDRLAMGAALLIAGAATALTCDYDALVGCVRPTMICWATHEDEKGFLPLVVAKVVNDAEAWPDKECFDTLGPALTASRLLVEAAAIEIRDKLGRVYHRSRDTLRPLILDALTADQAHELGLVDKVCSAWVPAGAALSSSAGTVAAPAAEARLANATAIFNSSGVFSDPSLVLEALSDGLTFDEFKARLQSSGQSAGPLREAIDTGKVAMLRPKASPSNLPTNDEPDLIA